MTSAKSRIESSLMPLALHIPLSPNILTLLAVVAMAAAAWFVLQSSFESAAALVLVSGFVDILDGTVAKAKKKATKTGAFLDRVCDRISDALIFGSVILAGLVQLWLGLAVLVLVMLGSYASACLEAFSKTRIGEKLSMRAIRLLIIFVSLLSMRIEVTVMEYAFYVVGLLAIVALVQRLWAARKLA